MDGSHGLECLEGAKDKVKKPKGPPAGSQSPEWPWTSTSNSSSTGLLLLVKIIMCNRGSVVNARQCPPGNGDSYCDDFHDDIIDDDNDKNEDDGDFRDDKNV